MGLLLRERRPRCPAVGRLPDAAAGRRDVPRVGVGRMRGDVEHAAGAEPERCRSPVERRGAHEGPATRVERDRGGEEDAALEGFEGPATVEGGEGHAFPPGCP